MQILIVGGTGLISTPITRMLVERGDQVTIYNRGLRPAQYESGYRRLFGDRTDFAAFEAQMWEAAPFDCVIDMACYRPEEAESAVRAFGGRTGQYIFCSTVDVYSKPATQYPIREEEERDPPAFFPYGVNKKRCEDILMAAHQVGAMQVTIIRPAHTYGEGRGLNHTFGRGTFFFDRLRKGKPIIVHGDGTGLWSSCYRDDTAQAFVGAVGNRKTYGRAYHVSGEEWLTWNEYHRRVAKAIGAPEPRLMHVPTDVLGLVAPERADAVVKNYSYIKVFDNAAGRRDLGFRYTVRFEEGVRRVVAWLDAHGGIEDSDAHPWYDQLVAAWQRATTQLRAEVRGAG